MKALSLSSQNLLPHAPSDLQSELIETSGGGKVPVNEGSDVVPVADKGSVGDGDDSQVWAI